MTLTHRRSHLHNVRGPVRAIRVRVGSRAGGRGAEGVSLFALCFMTLLQENILLHRFALDS